MLSWLGRLDGNEATIQKMKEKKKARDKAANIAAEEAKRMEKLQKEILEKVREELHQWYRLAISRATARSRNE